MQRSDPHSGGIKRHHIQSARGSEYSSQIGIVQTLKKITYFLQEKQLVRHSAHIKRDHVRPAGGKNRAVRSTFCRHQTDYVRSAGGGEPSSQIDILRTSNEITYCLQKG